MTKRKGAASDPEAGPETPMTWVLGKSRDFKPLAERSFQERGFRPVSTTSKWAPPGEDGAWFPTSWIADLNYKRLPS
jgi:hypothetical protein